jgi:hypothetical protein
MAGLVPAIHGLFAFRWTRSPTKPFDHLPARDYFAALKDRDMTRTTILVVSERTATMA